MLNKIVAGDILFFFIIFSEKMGSGRGLGGGGGGGERGCGLGGGPRRG